METINFFQLKITDTKVIESIATWYLEEWNIPIEKSVEKLNNICGDPLQIHLIMTMDTEIIGTGGIHNHVSLIDRKPDLHIYKKWLALVYTKPEYRRKGLGAKLCVELTLQAKSIGINDLYLFTHTAESLYRRLGWEEIERINFNERDIVLMKKTR